MSVVTDSRSVLPAPHLAQTTPVIADGLADTLMAAAVTLGAGGDPEPHAAAPVASNSAVTHPNVRILSLPGDEGESSIEPT
jgi:hypothetical protein